MTAESSGPPYEFHGERAGNARHAARARVGIARATGGEARRAEAEGFQAWKTGEDC